MALFQRNQYLLQRLIKPSYFLTYLYKIHNPSTVVYDHKIDINKLVNKTRVHPLLFHTFEALNFLNHLQNLLSKLIKIKSTHLILKDQGSEKHLRAKRTHCHKFSEEKIKEANDESIPTPSVPTRMPTMLASFAFCTR